MEKPADDPLLVDLRNKMCVGPNQTTKQLPPTGLDIRILECLSHSRPSHRLNGQKDEVVKHLQSLPQEEADRLRW
jgi:hypothetical protein